LGREPSDENALYLMTYELHPDRSDNEDDLETLVLIHGYGGSGLIFYRILEDLNKRFKVYLIDLLGMGRSARPEFEVETFEQCENFFVNSIEIWRQKMGLTNFVLCGHSFGGYISALYGMQFYKHIKKLLLLSPHGVVMREEGREIDRF